MSNEELSSARPITSCLGVYFLSSLFAYASKNRLLTASYRSVPVGAFGWFWIGACFFGVGGLASKSIAASGDLDHGSRLQEAIEDGGGSGHVADQFAPIF